MRRTSPRPGGPKRNDSYPRTQKKRHPRVPIRLLLRPRPPRTSGHSPPRRVSSVSDPLPGASDPGATGARRRLGHDTCAADRDPPHDRLRFRGGRPFTGQQLFHGSRRRGRRSRGVLRLALLPCDDPRGAHRCGRAFGRLFPCGHTVAGLFRQRQVGRDPVPPDRRRHPDQGSGGGKRLHRHAQSGDVRRRPPR